MSKRCWENYADRPAPRSIGAHSQFVEMQSSVCGCILQTHAIQLCVAVYFNGLSRGAHLGAASVYT